jgi:hypothetical protein
MKIAMALALALAFGTAGATSCTAGYGNANARMATETATFRLHVAGPVGSSLTFWVAYGPLDDRFGLIQLHSVGRGLYQAQSLLPAQGRTVFAYLVGRGTIHARFGPAPGNPVVTIRRIGPVSMADLHLPMVRWSAPVG